MNVPKEFMFYSGEVLSSIMHKYPDLKQRLTAQLTQNFALYRRDVEQVRTKEQFLEITDYFCASVKRAYCFHVTHLQKQELVRLLPRTVFSAYMSSSDIICGFVYLMPETVKAIDYHHRLYTDKLN